MATILLVPLNAAGHMRPSLYIAKALRDRGHRVVFAGLVDAEEPVTAAGFEFEPLMGHLLPREYLAEAPLKLARLKGLARLSFARDVVDRLKQVFEAVYDGEPDRLVERIRPDLFICDREIPGLSLIGVGHRLPTLILETGVPPPYRPVQGTKPMPLGRRVKEGLRLVGSRVLEAIGLRPPLEPFLARLAARQNVSMVYSGRLPVTLLGPGAPVPELILAPREFIEIDQGYTVGHRAYLGPCLELERPAQAFPWERIQEGKPLIFASLGTLAFGRAEDERFTRLVARAAALRPDWQFVSVVGKGIDPATLGGAPNLLAVPYAPQIELLRRASAMITHAGFNSAKECIYFGVPMVAFPLRFDQPLVTRMLLHHGLAAHGSIGESTPGALIGLLERVMRDPALKEAMTRMSARFRETNDPVRVAEEIERFLPADARAQPAA